MSSAGGFVSRRKNSPQFPLPGCEVEIVNLDIDAVRMREKQVVGVDVPVDDLLAGSNSREFPDRGAVAPGGWFWASTTQATKPLFLVGTW